MEKMNATSSGKRGRLALATAIALLMLTGTTSMYAQNLNLSKNFFKPGEAITVQFSAPGNYPSNAWVGIIPSNISHGSEVVNDQNDLVYQYLSGKTSGSLSFTAPTELGKYDFRMNDDDNSGHEVASVSFVVSNSVPDQVRPSSGMISLQRYNFKPGEKIVLTYSVPGGLDESAWIGIIPSAIAHGEEAVNDQNDIAYQYLKGTTSGTLEFTAPDQAGSWDLRLNSSDNSGKELSSVTFTVGGAGVVPQTGYNRPLPPALPPAEGEVIFNNWNKSVVDNQSNGAVYFYIARQTTITRITNYHWNNGSGRMPGEIGIKGPDGRNYGPWNSVGTSGTGGAQNVNWVVVPDVTLYPGVYQVTDSDPGTWSSNAGSFGCGFSVVMGK
jgi:hypothetical protein